MLSNMLSNERDRQRYLNAPPDQRDPTIPGEMYRVEGFSLITADKNVHSVHFDLESLHTTYTTSSGYIPSVGAVRNNDVVMFVGSYEARDGIIVYKVIKGDEMGFVPKGKLIFTHITEKDVTETIP